MFKQAVESVSTPEQMASAAKNLGFAHRKYACKEGKVDVSAICATPMSSGPHASLPPGMRCAHIFIIEPCGVSMSLQPAV